MTTDKSAGLAVLFRPHAAKRLSIVDAAANVFCREGYGGANIDLIAAEAGVSLRLVQYYFSTKEELLLGALAYLGGQLSARVRRFIRDLGIPPTPRTIAPATVLSACDRPSAPYVAAPSEP